jgi:hypothetical protein
MVVALQPISLKLASKAQVVAGRPDPLRLALSPFHPDLGAVAGLG